MCARASTRARSRACSRLLTTGYGMQASKSPLSGTPIAAAPAENGNGVRGGAAKRPAARPVGKWPDRDAPIVCHLRAAVGDRALK